MRVARSRYCMRSASAWRPGNRWPSWVHRARAKARCWASWPGWTCPRLARSVYWAGDLFALDEDARAALRGEHVGFVFQSFQLMAHLNALENVMLPLELKGDRAAREKHPVAQARRAGRAHAACPACCRAANSSAWRWPGPLWCSRPCCWPTAHRQPGPRHRRLGDGADVRAQPRDRHHSGVGRA